MDFIATPLKGYVNDVIQFTDMSTGDPIAWVWDFGDRSPHSSLRNPVHSYVSPGIYTIVLETFDGSTISSMVKENYIEIVYEDNGTGFVRDQGPTLIFD